MRIIAHLDMDAFFAAVEERDDPRLKGLPISVGADPRAGEGRGVVATANYKAREYGLHSALPISQAWRLSERARREGKPPVVFLAPHFDTYVRISEEIVSIVKGRAPQIERAGLDEMYFDLSFAGSYEKAEEIAEAIQRDIREKEKLTASIGIGPNKLIAKIASDRNKPDGLTVVPEEEAERFLEPLSVRKIPGIGPKTEILLNGMGIKSIADLKALPLEKLEEMMGKWGQDLYDKARGLDDSPVEESWEVKSIGEQETFYRDSLLAPFIIARLRAMAKSVFARFKEEGFASFRTVVVTIRFADFETKTKSRTLKAPAGSFEDFSAAALDLLRPFLDNRMNPRRKMIRLIGVRMEKLERAE
jgi:DNA polymerase IV (DinB-like DNA polymerase)